MTPLPETHTYQHPAYHQEPPMYDDWKLDTPPESPTDDDLDRAEDEYEQWLERRAHNKENNND